MRNAVTEAFCWMPNPHALIPDSSAFIRVTSHQNLVLLLKDPNTKMPPVVHLQGERVYTCRVRSSMLICTCKNLLPKLTSSFC